MEIPDLTVSIGKLTLKNPVLVASGTFGYGLEYREFIDITRLGAIITKAITLYPTEGNPQPRLVETTAGLINSIGLQNKGVNDFIESILPKVRELGVPVIVNIAGRTVREYKEVASRLADQEGVSGIEVNVSCPNVKEGGLAFGTDPKWTATVVKNVRSVTEKPVITKLSPNVTDLVRIAKASVDAGSDAVSFVNTFKAIAIDVKTRKPKLSTVTGGLSGPCIKPIAVRMVWEVYSTLRIPILGIGGIMSVEDALEFIIAGASAIQIGTGNFIDPELSVRIVDGIKGYLVQNGMRSIKELVGSLVIE